MDGFDFVHTLLKGKIAEKIRTSPYSLSFDIDDCEVPVKTFSVVEVMPKSSCRSMIRMIQAIYSTHGIVGISGIAEMLSSEPTIDDMRKNINYIGENFGWDIVAVGSDFLGMRGGTKGFTSFSDILTLAESAKQPDQLLHANAERVIRAVLR